MRTSMLAKLRSVASSSQLTYRNSSLPCVIFPSQVVYKTNDDHVTVVGAGVTLHEALAAAEQLKKGWRSEQANAY